MHRGLVGVALIFATVWCLAEAHAEVLYTRPLDDCANNGDGTAYACAASPGAAGAYRGTRNVVYGAGAAQVSNGDTLYVCGYHDGGSPLDNHITPTTNAIIDGNCPGDPGTFLSVFLKFTSGWTGPDAFGVYSQNPASGCPWHMAQDVDGVVTYLNGNRNTKNEVPDSDWVAGDWSQPGGCSSTYYVKPLGGVSPNSATLYTSMDNAIVLTNVAVTVQNLTIAGLVSNDCIVLTNADTSVLTGNTITKCALDAIGINAASDDIQIIDNNISMSGNAIYFYSTTTANNNNRAIVTGNSITDLDQYRFYANFTTDNHGLGIQGGDDGVYSDNTISHVAGSCITLYTEAAQSMKRNIVARNRCEDVRTLGGSTLNQRGIENGSTNAAHVANDVVDNIVVGNLLVDVAEECFWAKSSHATVGHDWLWLNNTAVNCGVGLLIEDAENGDIGFVFRNNLFVNATVNIDHMQNGTDSLANIIINNNLYSTDGAASFEWNGTKSNFASWKTNSSQDANSLQTDPLLINASDYRTRSTSPARAAGLSRYLCTDVRGRACYPDRADIGAYQSTSGDPAATRAVRN